MVEKWPILGTFYPKDAFFFGRRRDNKGHRRNLQIFGNFLKENLVKKF